MCKYSVVPKYTVGILRAGLGSLAECSTTGIILAFLHFLRTHMMSEAPCQEQKIH